MSAPSPITVSPQPAAANSSSTTCPSCGASIEHAHTDVNEDAQRRIAELESQVKILTGKATAAVDKLADYEDQLHALKAPSSSSTSPTLRPALQTSTSATSLPNTQSRSPSSETPRPSTAYPTPTPPTQTTTTRTSLLPTTTSNRFSSFLSRKSTPTPTPTQATHPSPPNTPLPLPPPSTTTTTTSTTTDLQTQLLHERQSRLTAETRLTQLNSEIEDLSSSLFSEANEMVANERKIRSKLEKRIEVLEGREGERGRRLERLERLEGAVGRVERVRGLLGEGGRG
ncbi:MAG: hypothetical protein M1812_005393 [Candelaria pacifica]|nr:MAG: hypothetical protein M1812_005393 [Candelaria pacifica]